MAIYATLDLSAPRAALSAIGIFSKGHNGSIRLPIVAALSIQEGVIPNMLKSNSYLLKTLGFARKYRAMSDAITGSAQTI